ncbi:MAG TPA: bifunctional serine/threonine-protein kinase/formylglycine-generating enzyme family protein [Gemmataceae bacterium]|nr:bifunctional serine/threonine-protein kinase/formylglycine-generating enzyme family protein [Gemmataceae bacterium]
MTTAWPGDTPSSPDVSGAAKLDFLSPAQKPDEMGRLGPYRVLKVLGAGGMGMVLLGEDPTLKRPVALKVMRPDIAKDNTARQRFLREAQATAAIDHHHIVPIHHVGEENGVPFIEMPLLKGEPLDTRLKRENRLPIAEAILIGKQIAEGLAEAHKNGLIHRDIKPANIWLSGEAGAPGVVVKIVDFGLARAIVGEDVHLTQTGTIVGTPAYMAPEQAKSEKVDFRCDLFSLGAVLYRMLTGELPFKGHDTMALLMALAMDTPQPIASLNPEVPPALADLVMQLLLKEPSGRPASAKAVAEMLGDMIPMGARSVGARRASKWERRHLLGRRAWIAVAGVVLAFLLVLILLPLLSRKQGVAKREDDKPRGPAPVITNTLGMKLLYIRPGKFMMGSSQAEIDAALKLVGKGSWEEGCIKSEGPQHEVEITRGFYMGETEVTFGQFRQFVDEAKYNVGDDRWKKPGWEQTDNHPVVFVDWNNAVAFCRWLSKKQGKKYRLPSEAEWEYSCRAGSKTRYSFGDNEGDLLGYAWINTNSQWKAHPVKGLDANAWKLYDMHGNIREWCRDVYDANYYKSSPLKDPPGSSAGGQRVVRGGSWNHAPLHCRSAFRDRSPPGRRDHYIGFRVVLVVPAGGVVP